MKRIVDGNTYNTDNSTLIARSIYQGEIGKTGLDGVVRDTLFKTKGGAFFLLKEHEDEDEPFEFTFASPAIVPMDHDEARAWMNTGEVEVIGEHPFGWPPEAGDDTKKIQAAE